MTDNTIPLPDAVRAFKDRPSMERELQELREITEICCGPTHVELLRLGKHCERLEAALKRIEEWGADDTEKWNREHPGDGMYLCDSEAMSDYAELVLKEEEEDEKGTN